MIVGFLVTSLAKALLRRFLSLASSKKTLSDSKILPIRMMEATVFLGTFNATEMLWSPSPDMYLDTILYRSSMHNSFDLMACFFALTCIVNCGTLYTQVWVSFQIMSNQLNLPQVGSNQVVETSRMVNGNRMHRSSISNLIAMGLNIYVNKVLFILNKLTVFTLSLWGSVGN